ncbi:DMT family transporter [Maricaulis sp.]|uniref:DMT family transporter n=1 Tax=Maricaulis sp. TaxID=1486257 RepID=UPI002613EBA9|nr:DMT family transporter [Maricaulis sp.]
MSEALHLASLAMLASASLHAVMGLLTKRAGDRLTFRAVMMLAGAVFYLPFVLSNPFPGWDVWRFLLLGAVLHWTFQMAMIAAFERGDMGLVYPVMRGAAPAMAAIAALAFLGESLSLWEVAGLAIASTAVLGFGWPEKGGAPKLAALGFAAIAAVMTALYTVNDTAGARQAGDPLLYVGWSLIVASVPILATAAIRRGRALPGLMRQELRWGAVAAVFGSGSYGFAMYALSNAPVGPMSALRETSVVFGALLAAWVLKEPFGLRRIALAILLAFGLVVMRMMST